ncbi:MAG: hypothetical protein HYT76_02170 [Deltaproteobacteria bacterium]|nr:hypothetical protein [Deltaproteobacteria bacterium]
MGQISFPMSLLGSSFFEAITEMKEVCRFTYSHSSDGKLVVDRDCHDETVYFENNRLLGVFEYLWGRDDMRIAVPTAGNSSKAEPGAVLTQIQPIKPEMKRAVLKLLCLSDAKQFFVCDKK